jgi:hypothetical protein
LNQFVKVAPAKDSDYHLEIKGEDEQVISLIRPSKEAVLRFIAPTKGAELDQEVKPSRKVVEARGLVEICKGDISKWIETYDMEELEFDFEQAWRPREVRSEGKVFRLAHPIACAIEKQEGLFISEFEPLDIIAYGESREEAIQGFSHEFMILWEAIARQQDSSLTDDAKSLKRKLHELVTEVTEYGSEENERH